MSDEVGYTEARTIGPEEVIIPAPCAITIYTGVVLAGGSRDQVTPKLVVGWNAAGSPIIVGRDGGLQLLDPDEAVTDVMWEQGPS